MKFMKLIPLILIAIGLALYFNLPSYIFGATVWFDDTPPEFESWVPAGTQDEPMTIKANQYHDISFIVKEPDTPITYVKVDLYKGTSPSNMQRTRTWLTDNIPVSNLGNGRYKYEIIDAFYANEEYYYKVVMTVKNKVGWTVTKTGWALAGDPTGDFYINGTKITSSTVLYVKSPKLEYKFEATFLGNWISSVYVEIEKGSQNRKVILTEIQADKLWKKIHSLPFGRGKYTITGKIEYPGEGGTPTVATLMVIAIPYGEEEIKPFMPKYQLYGIALIVIGAVWWIVSRKKYKAMGELA